MGWIAIGLGLGGNLGDPAASIAAALRCLEERGHVRIDRVSTLYRTPPWGPVPQPDFANACALARTDLAPRDLLAEVKAVEGLIGRTPSLRWGPRAIDIDILFYAGAMVETDDLVIPHESLFERAFVLIPLAEIAPDLAIGGRAVAAAAKTIDASGIRRWIDDPRETGATAMGDFLTLTAEDGVSISAYRAEPTGAPKGGVVVIQEIFGVNHHIRTVADRFAAEGYVAIAPALFDRAEKGVELGYDAQGMGRGMDLAKRSPMATAMMDVAAAIREAAKAGAVGVVGFCWGGTLAYAASAGGLPIGAAVGYYGGGIAGMAEQAPRAPTILHFGETDDHIPLGDIEKIRRAQPDLTVYTYPAGHGFNCDERASYDKASADLAWARTLAFFKQHVR